MKKSELRQIIREEIANQKSQRLDEGILTSLFGKLFKGATNREVKKIQDTLSKDKEYQQAKKDFENSLKDFQDMTKKRADKLGLDLAKVDF